MILPIDRNRLLLRLLQVALGAVFFYAGLVKNYHSYEFAEAVLAYQLLPGPLVGLAAAAVPWLELGAGLFLVIGLKRRSCLLLLSLLTGIFMLALVITLARGLKIDCGCGLFFQRQVGLMAILEDGLLLLGAGGLYYWELARADAALSLAAARPAS